MESEKFIFLMLDKKIVARIKIFPNTTLENLLESSYNFLKNQKISTDNLDFKLILDGRDEKLEDTIYNCTKGKSFFILIKRGEFISENLRVGGANLRPRKYAKKEGYENIPVISLGKKPWKDLSPFFLGPIEKDNEIVSTNVENYWQFHKVWETVDKQNQKKSGWKWAKERHVELIDGEYKVLPDYWKWREKGLMFEKAVRRPNGRNIPLFSLFEGERLDLIESRKRIYIPAYKNLLRKHPTYLLLLNKLRNGEKLIIIDLDGPRLDLHPEGRDVDIDKLNEWIGKEKYDDGRYFPYGHGYVVAMSLLEDLGY